MATEKKIVGRVSEVDRPGKTITVLFQQAVKKGNELVIAGLTDTIIFDGLVIRNTRTGRQTERKSVRAGKKVRFDIDDLFVKPVRRNARVYLKTSTSHRLKGARQK